jgi:hypothetical protein
MRILNPVILLRTSFVYRQDAKSPRKAKKKTLKIRLKLGCHFAFLGGLRVLAVQIAVVFDFFRDPISTGGGLNLSAGPGEFQ